MSVLYFGITEGVDPGRSPGKKFVGIVVLSLDGQPPSLRQTAIRSVFRLFDSCLLAPVGLLFILHTRLGQRLGDLFAGTIVARAFILKKENESEDESSHESEDESSSDDSPEV